MTPKTTLLALACALAVLPVFAQADDLGTAGQFNGYILGNATPTYTDVQGLYAVGGDATITATINADKLAGNYALVVGGTLNMTGDNVYGNVYTGVAANLNNPSVTGNINSNGSVNLINYGTVNGSVTYATTYANPHVTVGGIATQGTTAAPFDFNTINNSVKSKSTSWSTISANGTSNLQYGTLTLTGTDANFDVFNVTQSQLQGESTFDIVAPSTATVLVNIEGTSDTFSGGLNIGGLSNNKVMFNFYQATSLNISGIGVYGSVLAPDAAVNFASGQLNGTLVAGSLTGGGELHNDLFNGNIQAAPEPAGIVMLALGALPFLKRRRS